VALYLVTYDLIGKSFDQYETLIAELEGLGARRVLLFQWVLRSDNTAAEIRDHIRRFMHPNDQILVTAMGQWASWKAFTDINQI